MLNPQRLADETVQYNQALQFHQAGQIGNAIKIYGHLFTKHPADSALLGLLATALAQQGQLSTAISWFERNLSLNPLLERNLSNYINALQAAGQPDRSLLLSKRGIILQPGSIQNYVNAGKAQVLLGETAIAIGAYSRALLIFPHDVDVIVFTADYLFSAGSFKEALSQIQRAIILDPSREKTYLLEGKIQSALGSLLSGQQNIEKAVHINRFGEDAHLHLADHFVRTGQLDKADKAFRSLAITQPDSANAQLGIAESFLVLGAYEKAVRHYQRGLSVRPDNSFARVKLGTSLTQLAQFNASRLSFKQLIMLNPDLPEGYIGLGIAEVSMTRPEMAMPQLEKALKISPRAEAALACKGDALLHMDRLDDALLAYEEAIVSGGSNPAIHVSMANCHRQLGRYAEALGSFAKALELDPKSTHSLLNRGNLFLELRDYQSALADYSAVGDKSVDMAALCINRGNALFGLGRFQEALASYKRATEIDATSTGGSMGQAAVFQKLRLYKDALVCHEESYRRSHESAEHLGSLVYCSMKSWDQQRLHLYLDRAMTETGNNKDIGNPFPLLTCLDDPHLHRQVAVHHAANRYQGLHLQNTYPEKRGAGRRIVVGYFSSDLSLEHPVGMNLAPLLAAHDRDRFKLIGFSSSEEPSTEILRLFDEVHEVNQKTDREIATLARSLGIDIAIDLNGYTEGSRTEIFSHRAGRAQINYLGFPGTMGTDFHDFIIADGYVIPEGSDQHYTERVLRLPHFFMPYDFRQNPTNRAVAPSRHSQGLPVGAFIFCSFNDFHKITQKALETWIRILNLTTNSILWIARRGEITEDEIRSVFQRGGISSERIVIANRVARFEDHLARLSLADLMLDTFPYNSHTTACDAVAASLPLLTICGRSFASRVSGSLISEVGLPELIAQDWEDYVEKAVAIARHANGSRDVRIRLEEGKSSLVTPNAYARSLEHLYEMALSQSTHNLPYSLNRTN